MPSCGSTYAGSGCCSIACSPTHSPTPTSDPSDGRVARAALKVHRHVSQVVPNLTLKVDPSQTPDSLLLDAMETVVTVGQPHLVNHPMMVADLGERYGVVSCYNSLPVGGGAHTLVRLNLKEAALIHAGTPDAFLTDTLPRGWN